MRFFAWWVCDALEEPRAQCAWPCQAKITNTGSRLVNLNLNLNLNVNFGFGGEVLQFYKTWSNVRDLEKPPGMLYLYQKSRLP